MSIDFPLIIVDESTDARITKDLRESGYKILSIQESLPGIEDIDIIKLGKDNGGYILTEDKDFGDALVYRKVSYNGAMLLRLAGVDIEDKIQLILGTLEKHSEELLNAFAVLSKKKLRIKR